uniref:ER lumen protein-retaining receptor n=2 Tax=Mesocestoides corti TaxID=53468 RepID=A0A5K3FN64_MESCO
MNIFRLLGDMSHLLAIILLLLKIWKTRSCAGLSGKTQLMFALIFTTRYLDLFIYFVSTYNMLMKIAFVILSYLTCYLMFFKFKTTYNKEDDNFRILYLIIPSFILALLVNHQFSPVEVLWTFSIYLEAVAILPQLHMITKTGEAETITAHYLFALGSYRALYIVNWIYRYVNEDSYELIAIVAGSIQTVLYVDFFYLYVTRVLKGKSLVLPV